MVCAPLRKSLETRQAVLQYDLWLQWKIASAICDFELRFPSQSPFLKTPWVAPACADCPGFLVWVLLLPRPPPSARSLRLCPWASILLHGPLDICLDLLPATPPPPVQNRDAQHMFLQHRGGTFRVLSAGSHRVLQGPARRGAQFYFIFAVLQTVSSCSIMSLFYFKTCAPVKGTP